MVATANLDDIHAATVRALQGPRHVMYRCPGCRRVWRRTVPNQRAAQPFQLCACGQQARGQMVRVQVNPREECDTRCTDATGTSCSCSCAGRNHGSAHA